MLQAAEMKGFVVLPVMAEFHSQNFVAVVPSCVMGLSGCQVSSTAERMHHVRSQREGGHGRQCGCDWWVRHNFEGSAADV